MRLENWYLTGNGDIVVKNDKRSVIYNDDFAKKHLYDKTLRNLDIKGVRYFSNKDLMIIERNNMPVMCVHKYKRFLKTIYFSTISSRINRFNRQKLNRRFKLFKTGVAVGVTVGAIGIGVLISNSINIEKAVQYREPDSISEIDNYEEDLQESEIIESYISEANIENNFDQEEIIVQQNIECMAEQPIQESQKMGKISDIKDNKNYDEIIKFAANFYGIDAEVAKNVVNNNIEYILSSTNQVDYYIPAGMELDRYKDLSDKGIINPDITVVGIFVSLKNYAYDNGLLCGNPITSLKTPNEKKQDLIDIARYIYGVNDERMLANIIAIHELESDCGTSSLCVDKNNLGGNRNPDLSFTSFRTSEIGADAMIRHYLINYDKMYYNNDYDFSLPTEYGIALSYCETPNEWYRVVYSETNNILDTNRLDNYISNGKIL